MPILAFAPSPRNPNPESRIPVSDSLIAHENTLLDAHRAAALAFVGTAIPFSHRRFCWSGPATGGRDRVLLFRDRVSDDAGQA